MDVLAKAYLRLTILLCLLGTGIQVPTMYGCTNGWLTMEANSRLPIHCFGEFTSASAAWRIVGDDNHTLVFNGSCGVGLQCTNNGITLATTVNTADLTILDNRRGYDRFYVFCKETNIGSEYGCRINVGDAANSTTALLEESTAAGVQTTQSEPIYRGTSPSAGIPIQTMSTAIEYTMKGYTDRATDATSLPSKDGDDGRSLRWSAIGGGVAAAVVIIIVIVIVIVIFKRRLVVEEHVNVVYEPGGQENKHTSTSRHQPAINTTIASSYDDYHLKDGEVNVGYTTVDLNPLAHRGVNISASGNAGMTHTYSVPAIRHDVALDETELTDDFDPNYSAVNAPRPKTFAAPSLTSAHGDEYTVVDKRTKGKKGATFQPEVYAQVNKPKPNDAVDVYAKVDKSSKHDNSQVVQQNVDSADGGYYAEVRKPIPGNKPTLAVKPVLKPKPTLQPKSAANQGDGQAEPDEYNELNFGAPAQTVSPVEAEQQYSHIRMA